jgi:PAS domain S-box-containing protein
MSKAPRGTSRNENIPELFQLLVDNVKDYAIFILDTNGRALTWNAGVLRMLGYSEEEFPGLEFYRLFRPGEQDGAAREMQIAAANGRSDDERWHVRKDGSELWVTGVLTALRDEAGDLRGYAKIMRDTTLQKSAASEREELLQRELSARGDADRANRIKDEFLAIVSHELRTPLNAILGWTRMLTSEQLDSARARHALEIIERNARAQAQLIDDLLDVSRIITGKLQLDMRPLMLRDVVNAALESVGHVAQDKGVALAIDAAGELGPMEGDPGRLQQVVWNLLSNAVKFTPAGGQIAVRLQKDDHTLQLTVRDTGDGMETTELPLIFDRFHQAAQTRQNPQGGLGLGLAIARHIVEAHGGTIEAHSDGRGKGTTFTVILPSVTGVAPSRADVRKEQDIQCPPPLEGRRVLVVEDKADSRELLEVIFERCKMHVVSVDSAQRALDAMDRERFDVIVSDIGLSEHQDGLALMRAVRARAPGLGGRTPAVALTAYASLNDRQQVLAAGYQAHVTKPFEHAELIAAVASLLNLQGRDV